VYLVGLYIYWKNFLLPGVLAYMFTSVFTVYPKKILTHFI
jgi:hypothetical protein